MVDPLDISPTWWQAQIPESSGNRSLHLYSLLSHLRVTEPVVGAGDRFHESDCPEDSVDRRSI
jgi:hypothetical protein